MPEAVIAFNPNLLYFYNAIITDVWDGDTVTAEIDCGLDVWLHNQKLRLARIDAPELNGDNHIMALTARNVLINYVEGKQVYLQTIQDDKEKYGRWLAEIWLPDATLTNVNDQLVTDGVATYLPEYQ